MSIIPDTVQRHPLADGLVLIPMRVPEGPSILLDVMRAIRNVCREGFAHHRDEITAEQQAAWWAEMGPHSWAWVYRVEGSSEFAGFGLVRPSEHQGLVTTVAVTPPYRGKGIGGWITSHLIHQVPETIHGSALSSNPGAVRLHSASEWDEIESGDPAIRTFVTSPEIRARKTQEAFEAAMEGAMVMWVHPIDRREEKEQTSCPTS